MLGKKLNNQRGFTFLELIIVVVITVIITSVFVVSTRQTPADDVNSSTNQLLSDIRYARGLAASKAVYDFDGSGPEPAAYPPGGYGIYFQDNAHIYAIFADDGTAVGFDGNDAVIKAVSLDNTDLEIEDVNQPIASTKYFTFKSNNDADTNFVADNEGKFQMSVNYNPGVGGSGYKGVVTLGELASDGTIFVSLGLGGEGYTPVCSGEGGGCDSSQPCCVQLDALECKNSICSKVVTQPPPTKKSCFPAGVKVSMADGSYMNIEDVKVGDYVLSYDETTGNHVSAKVLELEAPLREHMCEIIFSDDDSLKLTNEHPVYTSEGWKSINPERTGLENDVLDISQLDLGNQVLFENGDYKEVAKINCWQEVIQTYNLREVDGPSTFFADDVVVHNAASIPGCGVTDPATSEPGVGAF